VTRGAALTDRRYKRLDTCRECNSCESRTVCDPARHDKLRSYGGILLTADGFDCALPVTIDSHSACSYGCLYCFAPNLFQRRIAAGGQLGQTSLSSVEAIFSGKPSKVADKMRDALKYDRRNAGGYPCPVQLGGLTDPMDNIERQQGWFLDFANLIRKYQQPVRVSTKGTLGMLTEYKRAVAQAPELWWVAFSTITCDDEVLARIDRRAPSATMRLRAMKALSKLGVKTSLRLRPMLPGISDATPRHPKALTELIDRAADAGAVALSTEVAFLPGAMTAELRERWQEIEQISGVPLIDVYGQFGPKQACTRPSYAWTEEVMHVATERARANGMTVGVSDPVWKQLGDTGCCCGMLPDDPVFGNWQRESATNRLLEARDGLLPEITVDDIIPGWARYTKLQNMVNLGAGPEVVYTVRHATWADKLTEIWDDVTSQRGPCSYFQGALQPVRRDAAGHMVYRYVGLQRQHRKAPYWRVEDEREQP
jgi:DNA repair photolyase